jgi:hypothetical protein
MKWKLKESENEFQVTREGPFEYKTFQHGDVYNAIPEEEQNRFEPANPEEGGGEQ